jgi:hypothetical protein
MKPIVSMSARTLAAAAVVIACGGAIAQSPAPAPANDSTTATPTPAAPGATPVDVNSLSALAWLEGCWRGTVNQREFLERWLPLRGGMMIGVSHNVMQDKTLDYDYLRLEPRVDGIHYFAVQPGKTPADFRLTKATTDERGTQFVFANSVDEFPQQIVYHRGAEGWLYATIEGKVAGEARTVTFPMRRVDCETGELIRK